MNGNKKPTLQELIFQTEQRFEQADLFFGHGTDNAYDEAYWAVAHAARLGVAEDLDLDQSLNSEQTQSVDDLVKERIETRKPLSYLINEAWFAGERFFIDERAIVPRSHFGEFVPEQFYPWIDSNRVSNILELCTGSGCIAVALAKYFPAAKVTATDLSAEALELARINIDAHNAAEQITLLHGDLFEPVAGQSFDLIVCNPPYVSDEIMAVLPAEYGFEPDMAFRAADQGIRIISRILKQAADMLTENGHLIVEAGSAADLVTNTYPDKPFTWLTSENGDSVVFLISKSDL